MSNAKRGLKALGLSLMAAMGLMAFTAVGAQAVTWHTAAGNFPGHETATGGLKAGQTALLLVPTLNLIIHCSSVDIESTLIYNTDPPKAHAGLLYLGCETLVKDVKSAGCAPEILLVKAILLPILHSGKVYLLAEPLTGSNFTTIHMNEKTCALPPLPNVTGSVVFECENGATGAQQDCAVLASPQLIRPAPPALFPSDTLQYGLNAAEIHGKAEVSLSGALAGQAFGCLI